MSLNNTVNNWATEIKSFKIKFIPIAGKYTILTDTLNMLINIDPDMVLEPELKDYEFGHYCFENLPKAKSTSVRKQVASVNGIDIYEINITYDNPAIPNFPFSYPCITQNLLVYRGKMQKFANFGRKSAMAFIQTFISLKMTYFTGLW